ncbi:bifunctional 2',3'-cyclic-nucleotide 2'-phosphodiesterase/3'-nucleotidase [Roseovarius rhodophyticola]|uniref:Bifunctional 2',3'-cyclic-nucleotide 2'-phosphodiesterase/3'-nucleotidase n=1 Tax=Roseovarius rhodophyticola TaxID=3080827 RepID=A0ABZ2TL94_9RHOB|nr:bifunctional 2',3'-cyclic-nucleotide 2'-phosphodiesterase/3'-nucleotidase [Roseovarius sp. W115]MDV2929507.1 bifunctional 2',3'-cyclic-nucleotide 2'-phosphodiesterase/3'-nucleotidase [Roseovarius sp. W115]
MKRTNTLAYSDTVTWPWRCDTSGRVCVGAVQEPDQHIWVRILGTTDLHGHILSYDYAKDAPVEDFGFARVVTQIHKARAEAQNTLLFDNGDFLQGSALTDIGARPENGWTKSNPVINAMNHVTYDAATLGNHEFNFGLDWLTRTLKGANFPLVCANAVHVRHPSNPEKDQHLLPPFILLNREVHDNSGHPHKLKIGVIGLVPPQILLWDQDHLAGRLEVRDMVETLKVYVPLLRSKGAQIVVVLAHTGIGEGVTEPDQENVGLALAHVPGVDAILTGHTHNIFPDPADSPHHPAISVENGALADVPSIMAGFRGSHLGVIDLKLAPQKDGWRITDHFAEVRPVDRAGIEPDKTVSRLVDEAHQVTLAYTSKVISRTCKPIHSYLSQFRPDLGQYLIMACKRDALADALADTPFAGVPILSVSAPYKTGGAGGPGYYTDIAAGDIFVRDIADIYPFPNTLVGIRVQGAQIVAWLERAVSCFQQVVPGKMRQHLWNPDFAGHTFDTICGLTYNINLTQPARYNESGAITNPKACRIGDLRHQGRPVSEDDDFILALKSFRAFSSGMVAYSDQDRLVYTGQTLIRDLLMQYIKKNGCDFANRETPSWAFLPVENASVCLETGPGVTKHHNDMESLSARALDQTERGFLRLEIPLE